jgi:hypothetical protein
MGKEHGHPLIIAYHDEKVALFGVTIPLVSFKNVKNCGFCDLFSGPG